jgi:hypothetical protein
MKQSERLNVHTGTVRSFTRSLHEFEAAHSEVGVHNRLPDASV